MREAIDDTPVHRIGEAARRSGVSAANIRYYEREGLLPTQVREANDYRLYSEADLHRLRFVRLCRAMDMSLDEVRTLLDLNLSDKADCLTAREALDEHLAHVRARLSELRAHLARALRWLGGSLRDHRNPARAGRFALAQGGRRCPPSRLKGSGAQGLPGLVQPELQAVEQVALAEGAAL